MIASLLRFLRLLPPEKAHRVAIYALQWQHIFSRQTSDKASDLRGICCFGLHFAHRLGVAAGFDKDAEAYQGLWQRGFAFVEVGTVTPKPQFGNPRPRLFRLTQERAVINRMGFNNQGMEAMAKRLAREKQRIGVLGINIGPNKDAKNPLDDYRDAIATLAPFADYLAINLSSPNTPGLRALQHGEQLRALLQKIQESRHTLREEYGLHPPVLLKIAPDWDCDDTLYALLDQAVQYGIDGLIISNTTTQRPEHWPKKWQELSGGLSGQPLLVHSTQILAKAYCHLQGAVPLIGVGGVSTVSDAILKMQAGASLVQVYTSMVYGGDKCLTDLSKNNSKDHVFYRNACQYEDFVIGENAKSFRSQDNITQAVLSRNEKKGVKNNNK